MASEVQKAQLASETEDTIFGKIVRGEIPTKFIYEDDKCVAFHDINPPGSYDKAILGHILFVAQHVAKEQKLDKGFRIVINDGPQGCQSVYHVHIHVLGGRQLGWPPG
ncbi:hypothetical protein MTO96_003343 [Rhipicephalus appendiculatus]